VRSSLLTAMPRVHTCCTMLSTRRYLDVLQFSRGGFCRCHIHSWTSRVNGGILCVANAHSVLLLGGLDIIEGHADDVRVSKDSADLAPTSCCMTKLSLALE